MLWLPGCYLSPLVMSRPFHVVSCDKDGVSFLLPLPGRSYHWGSTSVSGWADRILLQESDGWGSMVNLASECVCANSIVPSFQSDSSFPLLKPLLLLLHPGMLYTIFLWKSYSFASMMLKYHSFCKLCWSPQACWKPSLLKLPSTHHVYCPLGLTYLQPGTIGIGLLAFPFLWLLALEGWDSILCLTQLFDRVWSSVCTIDSVLSVLCHLSVDNYSDSLLAGHPYLLPLCSINPYSTLPPNHLSKMQIC